MAYIDKELLRPSQLSPAEQGRLAAAPGPDAGYRAGGRRYEFSKALTRPLELKFRQTSASPRNLMPSALPGGPICITDG